MKSKNRQSLRIPGADVDSDDEIVDQIMDELNEEESPLGDLEAKIANHKKRFWFRGMVIAAVIIAAVIIFYVVATSQTYGSVRITENVVSDTDGGGYVSFADGILKYSKDGVSFLNSGGKEQWNYAYQIKNPIIDVAGKAGAIADSSGNTIVVFEKSGVKGEITTTLPIEKISVSEQGIVAAVLKNDYSPKVICYDKTGNILVEHKTAAASTGYPIDISISPNGELLVVSYLYTQDNQVAAKVSYFNFGTAGKDKVDHQVAQAEYQNSIVPEVFFASQERSVIAGDKQIDIYKGEQHPKLETTIKLKKEIKSICHNDKYIGLILQNEGKEGYELKVYNMDGKPALSLDFTGEYSHVDIIDGQVIMYDGDQMAIYMLSGHKRFEGSVNANILGVMPMVGFNKYLVMSTSGVQIIRLVK